MAPPFTIRRATPADRDVLLRLLRLMMELLDDPVHRPAHSDGVDWETAARAFLVDGFATDTVVAFLAVPDAGGAVVGGGVGNILQRLSGPWNPTGRYGHI